MRIHHLNCGTLNLPLGVALVGTGGLLTPACGVIHCVLVETDDGLLLVDTGFGTRDCITPTPFIRLMMALGGSPRDLEETAAKQVERLGYVPEDVRHIVLTHFHYDHVGGLPDFPRAKVHIFKDEYEAVMKPQGMYEQYPYRAEHWSHGPDWEVHRLQGGRWFGFDCTPLVDLGSTEFCLVPLPGHTRGHSGVALRLPDGWLFHCGDAYTFHGDVDPQRPFHPPYYRLIRPLMNLNKAFRQIGKHAPRLRALLREHGDRVRLTCSHDPREFEKFGSGHVVGIDSFCYLSQQSDSTPTEERVVKKPQFVSSDFYVPSVLETERFRLRMLSVNDVEKDYEAVIESRELLHSMFGGPWPREGFTLKENLRDLERHQQEFLNREAFAYTVVSLDESRVLGCVYINPPRRADADAEVHMWVRQSEYDRGLDEVLFQEVRNWMGSSWPFATVAYPGREQP
jgi:glyoxylase-like metal-dependent hydrolase (beta-lactamase superfamily II)